MLSPIAYHILVAIGDSEAHGYAIMHTVAQWSDEIGLRMALGARGADVMRLVAGRGMALALGGMALGLAAGVATTRVLSACATASRPETDGPWGRSWGSCAS